MAHPFPADFLLCYFHTATVADNASVSDPLVFSAMALIVLGRSEDLFAEKTVSLRLVCPVVDCLWLQDLAG